MASVHDASSSKIPPEAANAHHSKLCMPRKSMPCWAVVAVSMCTFAVGIATGYAVWNEFSRPVVHHHDYEVLSIKLNQSHAHLSDHEIDMLNIDLKKGHDVGVDVQLNDDGKGHLHISRKNMNSTPSRRMLTNFRSGGNAPMHISLLNPYHGGVPLKLLADNTYEENNENPLIAMVCRNVEEHLDGCHFWRDSDLPPAHLDDEGRRLTDVVVNGSPDYQVLIFRILSDIQSNQEAIKENQEDLDESQAAIKENQVALAANQDAIRQNQLAIHENQNSIKENQGAIKANQGAIQKNQAAIKANQGAIADNRELITGLISRVQHLENSRAKKASDGKKYVEECVEAKCDRRLAVPQDRF